jgi:hypothetical protein
MKSVRMLMLTLACSSVSSIALAETPSPTEPASATVPPSEANSDTTEPPLFSIVGDRVGQGVGVETSVLWPFYPGYLFVLRAALPVAFDGRGQVLLGMQGHAPHARSEEGTFSSLSAQAGFRAYLWKGLHVDATTTLGAGMLQDSVVDGEDYASFDLELMATAGWRFEVGPVYALLQPLGIGSVVYRSNPWAIVGEGRRTTEPPVYVGNVLLGVQF